MAFNDRLKKCRREAGITQYELAYLADISVTSIRAYESGRVEPTLSKALRMANALEVSLDYLAGWEEDEEI